jgi:hypothetical protein
VNEVRHFHELWWVFISGVGLLVSLDGLAESCCDLAALRGHRNFRAGGPRHRLARGHVRRAGMRVAIMLLCLGLGAFQLWTSRVIVGPEATLVLTVAMGLMIATSICDRWEGSQILRLVLQVEQRELDAHQRWLRASAGLDPVADGGD